MSRLRRLRVPALLVAALAALLVFAVGASAETRTGESTSVLSQGGPNLPEATLVKASGSYDSTGGTVSFNVVTAAEPHELDGGGEPSETHLEAGLFTTTAGCSYPALVSGQFSPPFAFVSDIYGEPEARAFLGTNLSEHPSGYLPAAKTVSGSTITLTSTSASFANLGFNCAIVYIQESRGVSYVTFAISAPTVPVAPTPSPPAAAPAVLSIAKAKPTKLKVGKTKTVKIKVTNTGATPTVQGSLRVKPAKGVIVRPEVQKLPALAPGASWTVSVRLKLTEKASEKSTLSLTGTAATITGRGSITVKRTE